MDAHLRQLLAQFLELGVPKKELRIPQRELLLHL